MNCLEPLRVHFCCIQDRAPDIFGNAHDTATHAYCLAKIAIPLLNIGGIEELGVVDVLQVVNDADGGYDCIEKEGRRERAEQQVRLEFAFKRLPPTGARSIAFRYAPPIRANRFSGTKRERKERARSARESETRSTAAGSCTQMRRILAASKEASSSWLAAAVNKMNSLSGASLARLRISSSVITLRAVLPSGQNGSQVNHNLSQGWKVRRSRRMWYRDIRVSCQPSPESKSTHQAEYVAEPEARQERFL